MKAGCVMQLHCHPGLDRWASPCCDVTQRSCHGLAVGSGQPKEKLDHVSAELCSLCCDDVWCVWVIMWLMDL